MTKDQVAWLLVTSVEVLYAECCADIPGIVDSVDFDLAVTAAS